MKNVFRLSVLLVTFALSAAALADGPGVVRGGGGPGTPPPIVRGGGGGGPVFNPPSNPQPQPPVYNPPRGNPQPQPPVYNPQPPVYNPPYTPPPIVRGGGGPVYNPPVYTPPPVVVVPGGGPVYPGPIGGGYPHPDCDGDWDGTYCRPHYYPPVYNPPHPDCDGDWDGTYCQPHYYPPHPDCDGDWDGSICRPHSYPPGYCNGTWDGYSCQPYGNPYPPYTPPPVNPYPPQYPSGELASYAATLNGATYTFSLDYDNSVIATNQYGQRNDLGGTVTSQPLALSMGNDIYVFARGTDGAVWYRGLFSFNWMSLGGSVNQILTISRSGYNNDVTIRAVGSDNRTWMRTLYTNWQLSN